jgi:hypothetical protein
MMVDGQPPFIYLFPFIYFVFPVPVAAVNYPQGQEKEEGAVAPLSILDGSSY